MRRYQIHMTLGGSLERDPEAIVIVNASSEESAIDWLMDAFADVEFDMTEVCCDGCSHTVDDCACKEAA